MKIVCDQKAQLRINGKIHTIQQGEILSYDGKECPPYFRQLGKATVKEPEGDEVLNFELMMDAELLEMEESEEDLESLKAYMKKSYPEVAFAQNIGWDKLILRFIEGRENKILKVDNTGKTANTIVEVSAQLASLDAELEKSEEEESLGDLDELLGE